MSSDEIIRRNGDYKPTIWSTDYIESLEIKFAGELYKKRIDELKEEVRVILVEKENDPLAELELIDTLHRLGISYHFQPQIDAILKANHHQTWKTDNLYLLSLKFRLMRQNLYSMTSECFKGFKDESGDFKASLCEDIRGLLSLYEASYHSFKDEAILDEARDFSTKHLQDYINNHNKDHDDDLAVLVGHALELPRHWSVPRLEARWFIDVYEKTQSMNPTVLELAVLDFNVVQSIHIEDLKDVSRWWSKTKLGEKCPFARDRVVESFMWAVGTIFLPEFGYCRRMITRLVILITVLDDVFDVYATPDELKPFGDALVRWDLNAIDELPYYMQICFLATYNCVNEIAFDILRDHGILVNDMLKKLWARQIGSYIMEANWYERGHTPSFEEYMENALVSVALPMILSQACFWVTNPISEETIQCLMENPSIVRHSAIICRLADDLGTASGELERGDVSKSIQCHMHEAGVSEGEARRHINHLISNTWKQLNEDCAAKSPFSPIFKDVLMNGARIAQSIYQHGDGHGSEQDVTTKNKVLSVLVHPVAYQLENSKP